MQMLTDVKIKTGTEADIERTVSQVSRVREFQKGGEMKPFDRFEWFYLGLELNTQECIMTADLPYKTNINI